MAIRKNAPMGFVDIVLEDLGSSLAAKLLNKIDANTPWDTLARPITQRPRCTARLSTATRDHAGRRSSTIGRIAGMDSFQRCDRRSSTRLR